jgi:hypothetical protein
MTSERLCNGRVARHNSSGEIMNSAYKHPGFFDNKPGDNRFGDDGPFSATDNDGLLLWGAAAHKPSGALHPTPSTTSDTTTGNTSTTGTTVTGTGTTSSSPFVINITWDSSVQSAPSGFTAGVLAAVQYLESQFSDHITININVGYGEVMNTALGGGELGESRWYLTSVGYSQLASALTTDATSTSDASAVASLPAGSPVNLGTFWTTTAQAKALGLMSATSTGVDGYVGFSSSYPFTYDNSNGVAGGTYDFNGIVLHEITEVMGRALLTGGVIGSTSNSYTAYDLLHYSSPGVRDFSASTPGYFSVDGGNTNLAAFNTVSGGDAGDWASSVTNDAFDAFLSSGVVNAVSNSDLTSLDAIGWNLTSAPAPTPPPPPPPTPTSTPTGVLASPITASLTAAQASNGLAASRPLIAITQTGGTSGDTYGYSLGGTGSAAFKLSSGSSTATLATGSTGVAGGANGKLYSLSVVAKDLNAGTSSPASALNVVVGSSGNDNVSLATLVGGLGTASPAFIYGLGGADKINGAGMTGSLWITGGAGADTMSGGSGANHYLYGAASDSTNTSTDVVTNFHPSMDVLDLTGLGSSLKYAGELNPKGKLNAHSVGWQTSGGNTFVYANTSSSSGSAGSTEMKIELLGKITLSSGNILHV